MAVQRRLRPAATARYWATLYEFADICGVASYLVSCVCLQMGFRRGSGFVYAGLKLPGSSLFLLSLAASLHAHCAAIQIALITISIVGIIRRVLISSAVRVI